MKKTFKILIIAFLLCIFVYICKIESIPNNIILYNGEKVSIGNFWGITLNIENKDILEASNITETKTGSINAEVKLFDLIPVKEVSIDNIEQTSVIPVGQVSGLKLYISSSLVVGMGEIKGEDNKKYKPYENSGIQEGDRIIKVDDIEITDTNTLINVVNKSNGKSLEIEYVRDGEINNCQITPIKQADGTYKLGLWVRDSSAGIGTLTFYEPTTRKFCSTGTWNNRCRHRRFNRNF